MPEAVYLMCSLTSAACAFLLLRQYFHARTPLIFWSSLCFIGLMIVNLTLFIDLVVLPNTIDLSRMRAFFAMGSILVLVYGLIRVSQGARGG